MDRELLEYLCKYYAFSTGAAVRLYYRGQLACVYSAFEFQPDPFILYERKVLENKRVAEIFTTELFQFYGCLHLEGGYSVVMGPSCVVADDRSGLENMMFLLGVPVQDRAEYRRKLCCAPTLTAERLAFSLAFFATAAMGKVFPAEQVSIDTDNEILKYSVRKHSMGETFLIGEDGGERHAVEKSYSFEKTIVFYIRTGHPEPLRQMLDSMPDMVKAGEMARDTLRQLKNMGICSATISSRAAIEGGLDPETAFRLSDYYIQRFEILKDTASIHRLTNQMLLEYASRIQQIKYPCGTGSHLFQECARYISLNLFTVIRVEDLARNLGLSRTYLCSQFRQTTGITLSRFIMAEKITEAKRLLEFTDKSISDIAAHLAFSSQSHFQTAFKKETGETPMEFRLSHT